MNVVRFTLFGVIAVGVVVAAACLPDPDAVIPLPSDGGTNTIILDGALPPGCGDGIIATNDDGSPTNETCDPGLNDIPGCTAQCQISCGGVVGPSGHCYFVADNGDFNTARINCANAGAHLVTIGSPAEAALVGAFVGDAGAYRISLSDNNIAWSNVQIGVEEPGWPLVGNTCPGCFAEGADPEAGTFAPLAADSGTDHHCLVAAGDGSWRQVSCSADAGVTVCEREPAGHRAQYCSGPYCTTVAATAGKKRYVISTGGKASADDAEEFCRSYAGGSLVVLDSREEREELAYEIRQLVGKEQGRVEFWIGLNKPSDTADWQWDDDAGRDLPWADGEPRGAGRAFMRLDAFAFDSTLVATDEKGAGPSQPQRLFVCQRSPPIGDAAP